jgi:acetyl esterase/lipase
MFLLKILLLSLILYGLLYWLVPKGFFLHEGLRLPPWVFRMETFPHGDYHKEKYAYGNQFRQYLLYFQPKKNSTPKNHVIVYIHGGGWQFGRPEMFRANAKIMTDLGYHVFMPSHRRIPFYNIEDLREDMLSATLKILEIMRAEGLEDKKIILGGISSGGNLAALLAFDRSILEKAGLRQSVFSALFLLGAPLHLEGMWKSPPLRMLAGKRNGGLFRKASPILHVQKGETLPTLILHGIKDGLVEYSSIVAFYEKMKEEQAADIRLMTLPDGNHLDSASWCFENHPSHKIVVNWLAEMDSRW